MNTKILMLMLIVTTSSFSFESDRSMARDMHDFKLQMKEKKQRNPNKKEEHQEEKVYSMDNDELILEVPRGPEAGPKY